MEKAYYTAQETADLFSVELHKVYAWIKDGTLTGTKGPDGKWQITQADIDTAIKNLQKRGIIYTKQPL